GVTPATSTAFNVAVGTPTQLVFSVQPSNATAGAAIAPAVQVTAQDAQGNTATQFSGSVTVALGTNLGGGTLSGTMTIAAVGGVAAFNNLSIDKAGTGYTLAATATGLSPATSAAFNVAAGYTLAAAAGGLATVSSAPFNIAAGAATHLVVSVQPSNATAGAPITPAVQVTALDAQGNTATAFTATVTLAIGANPGGGTLSGTTAVAAAGGVATFPGLSINKAGVGYTLAASATGVSSVTSATFTVAPGTATQLAFTTQPSNTAAGAAITPAVQVTALDGQGNTATGFTSNVTVALGANPGSGTLSGTTTVAAV